MSMLLIFILQPDKTLQLSLDFMHVEFNSFFMNVTLQFFTYNLLILHKICDNWIGMVE